MYVRIDKIHAKDHSAENPAVGDVVDAADIIPAGDHAWGPGWSKVYFDTPQGERTFCVAKHVVCPADFVDVPTTEATFATVPLFMSTDSAERKMCPVGTGFLGYFPDGAMCVAYVSYVGNQKHNPGEPLRWAKEKSADEPDAEARHMLDTLRGLPPDHGLERLGELGHYASKAWRAMADLQRACDRVRKAYEAAKGTP